jgi:hypothetical protein
MSFWPLSAGKSSRVALTGYCLQPYIQPFSSLLP